MDASLRLPSAVMGLMLLFGAPQVHAQVIGTFHWQFAPYCNVITLTVEQKGPSFVLSGFDDLCGASQRAPASGTAQPNPDGTIGLGITVLRPDGLAVHHTAALSLATLGGIWFDNYGNTGALSFVLNIAGPFPGNRRPVTVRGNYGVHFQAPSSNSGGISAFSYGLTLPAPPVVHYVRSGGPAVAECPGTATSPQAAPGHLCVYEAVGSNIGNGCVARTAPSYDCEEANTSGAAMSISSTTGGNTYSTGTWALTVP